MNIKVLKIGSKSGLYLPNKSQFKKGEIIQITAKKNNKKYVFLTKFNKIISIRKQVEKELNLKIKDIINIEIKKINNLKRTKSIFHKDKIDLLSLIPEKTSKGYKIIVTPFLKNNENWIRIWYSHFRGSGRQLVIKRFVDIKKFGSLLGQYQAEGTKNLNKKYPRCRLEFKNKLVNEHNDFIRYLMAIGIQKKEFKFSTVFNLKNKNKAEVLINELNEIHKIKVQYYVSKHTRGIGISSMVRNTLLFEIIYASMNCIRKKITNKIITCNERLLAYSFLSKLLTGDGSLEYRRRYINNIDCRIKIADGNQEYLDDYKKILSNLGFKSYIYGIEVRAYCNKEKLNLLRSIGAFQNSKNWEKLNQVIKMI